jgi:hypothetical protein
MAIDSHKAQLMTVTIKSFWITGEKAWGRLEGLSVTLFDERICFRKNLMTKNSAKARPKNRNLRGSTINEAHPFDSNFHEFNNDHIDHETGDHGHSNESGLPMSRF